MYALLCLSALNNTNPVRISRIQASETANHEAPDETMGDSVTQKARMAIEAAKIEKEKAALRSKTLVRSFTGFLRSIGYNFLFVGPYQH